MAKTAILKVSDISFLREAAETHPALKGLRARVRERFGWGETRSRQFVERLMIAAFSEMNERYVGRMGPHLDRVLKLRDELTSIYDRAIKGERLDLHPEHVEAMFSEMAKEMEAMKSPTQAVGEDPHLVPDDLVSRTMSEISGEEGKPVTAQPKSGPTVPEGFEDIFEYSDVQEREKLIGKPMSRKPERGIDVHQYQKALDEWALKRLAERDPRITGKLFLNERPPDHALFEFEVTDPKTGKVYRMDAVDFENGVIYEIKSDAPGQSEEGQSKLDKVYKPLMDQEHTLMDGAYPRPGGWKKQVSRYDRAVAEQLLYGE